MPLILTGQPPIHWALAGAGIGAITLLLLFLANHRLGVSSGLEDVCSLALRFPYLLREEILGGRTWRLPFVLGLFVGGLVSGVLAHGFRTTWALGPFDAAFGWGSTGKVVWMFVGGLLIGFGTRMAGGCTAGHGIFGVSNFERASWISTATFLLTGIATTAVVYGVIAR